MEMVGFAEHHKERGQLKDVEDDLIHIGYRTEATPAVHTDQTWGDGVHARRSTGSSAQVLTHFREHTPRTKHQ